MQLYTGPWAYDTNDKSVPASVRLRNIGAIGRTKDNHEARFGALDARTLPASDGTDLPTPVFPHVYGGAAFWGHYVIRRASFAAGKISIQSVMRAYSTGNADQYTAALEKDCGFNKYYEIDLWGDPDGYHKAYQLMLAMGRWEAGARSKWGPGFEAFNIVYNTADQAVVDELYWGMVHGMREAWRDAGYSIERTPEEMNYEAPEHAVLSVEEDEDEDDADPLINGVSGWRTVITGALGIVATFFTAIFDLLGLENAEKLGQVSAQVLIALAALFLILKFWKRLERILKQGVASI